VIPSSIFRHRPDMLQDQEVYEGVMQLDTLLAHHKAGVPGLTTFAKKFPVDPAIIEEVCVEHFSRPSEEELAILCASGAQWLFENDKNRANRTKFKTWVGVVRTRIKKATTYTFPTPAQWLSIYCPPSIGLLPL
jgi:hypothetical protein